MADGNELSGKIFGEAELGNEEVAERLANALSGTVSGPFFARLVRTSLGEIEIRNNPDADPVRARAFPDGFLFFRHALELDPFPATRPEDWVSLVGNLLRFLWSQGWPAVAACDDEDRLPFGGRYNNRSVPWIARELQPE
jgi:hypothetical protein